MVGVPQVLAGLYNDGYVSGGVCTPLMQCRRRRPQVLPPQQESGLEQGQELVEQPLKEQWW